MNKPFFVSALLLAGTFLALPAAADPAAEKLKKKLSVSLHEYTIDEVQSSPVAGLYEVTIDKETVYVSADGKYMFTGEMIELETRTNLTQSKRGKQVLAAVEAAGEKNMIVIGPANARRTITVFTDVDCSYCAKFHNEVPALNKAGIRVRYLLYPRNGVNSPTYKRSVAVWCAADRAKAVGIAKAGGALDMKTCDNPVSANYNLGRSLGISGTPTLVLDNGQLLPGYVPADQLIAGFDNAAGKKPK